MVGLRASLEPFKLIHFKAHVPGYVSSCTNRVLFNWVAHLQQNVSEASWMLAAISVYLDYTFAVNVELTTSIRTQVPDITLKTERTLKFN